MKESFEIYITPEAMDLMKTPSSEAVELLSELKRVLNGTKSVNRKCDYFGLGVENSFVAFSVLWSHSPHRPHVVLLYETDGGGCAFILASDFESQLETATRFEMC
jgi:hypothetical protein